MSRDGDKQRALRDLDEFKLWSIWLLQHPLPGRLRGASVPYDDIEAEDAVASTHRKARSVVESLRDLAGFCEREAETLRTER